MNEELWRVTYEVMWNGKTLEAVKYFSREESVRIHTQWIEGKGGKVISVKQFVEVK